MVKEISNRFILLAEEGIKLLEQDIQKGSEEYGKWYIECKGYIKAMYGTNLCSLKVFVVNQYLN